MNSLRHFFKQYRIEIIIFIFALSVRLIFFAVCLHADNGNLINVIHGQDGGFEISHNLLVGNGFSGDLNPPFNPQPYRTILYPLFLATLLYISGGSYLFTTIIQILISSAFPLLGMKIARHITRDSKIPVVTGILLAIVPYQILFSFIFYSEALFSFIFGIFLITFLSFVRNPSMRYAVWSGFLLGLATLIKPTVEYLPFICIAFLLWHFRGFLKKELLLKFFAFALFFILAISPWLYRNYHEFGSVSLSSAQAFNLYTVLVPSVLAIHNGSSFADEQASRIIKSYGITLANADFYTKSAIAELKKYPLDLMKLSGITVVAFFTHDGMLTFLQNVHVVPQSYLSKPAILLFLTDPLSFSKVVWNYLGTPMLFVFLGRLFWILVSLFFFYGVYGIIRSKKLSPEILFLLIIVGYFLLTTLVVGLSVNARFRMPVEPILLAVACVGLARLYYHVGSIFLKEFNF
jgi:4-amino-4-deoxy-L-arabinose transferase-like glycosyltransferase